MIGIVTMIALGTMLGAIAQNWPDARSRARQGIVGDWVYADHTRRERNGINAAPQVAQITTVTVTDLGTDLTPIVITIDGFDVETDTGTGLTLAQIGAKLAAAINAEPLVGGRVWATFSTATLTLTGLTPGQTFTVSESDASLSAVTTTQSAVGADAVPFGRAIIHAGYNPGGRGSGGETERLVALASTARFTAQVQTITVPYVASAVLNTKVYEVRRGEEYLLAEFNHTSATDQATTVAAIAAGLEAANRLPANTVAVTSSATAVIFTSEIAGYQFRAVITHVSGGASSPAIASVDTVPPSKTTSLNLAWEGISGYSPIDSTSTNSVTDAAWAPNKGVVYGVRGVKWVASDEAVTAGAPVYVELAPGATAGRFYASGSATRVALSRSLACWERDGLVATDSIAAIRLEA